MPGRRADRLARAARRRRPPRGDDVCANPNGVPSPRRGRRVPDRDAARRRHPEGVPTPSLRLRRRASSRAACEPETSPAPARDAVPKKANRAQSSSTRETAERFRFGCVFARLFGHLMMKKIGCSRKKNVFVPRFWNTSRAASGPRGTSVHAAARPLGGRSRVSCHRRCENSVTRLTSIERGSGRAASEIRVSSSFVDRRHVPERHSWSSSDRSWTSERRRLPREDREKPKCAPR